MARSSSEDERVQPATRAAWRRWLERHHGRGRGVWLVAFKKSSGKARLAYDDVVEEALCVGWIDGQARALDADRSMLWLAPRKARSVWSAPNKARVARLTAEGRMQPAGLAAVAVAKDNGSWNALDAVDRLEVPPDLAAALDHRPDARRHFDAFPVSVRKVLLTWVGLAKRPDTRARRIEETVRRAAGNLRPDRDAARARAARRRSTSAPSTAGGRRD